MTPEYLALIAALRRDRLLAHSARPNAPVLPTAEIQPFGERLADLRRWVSADLRRLADRLEPAPPAVAHDRAT